MYQPPTLWPSSFKLLKAISDNSPLLNLSYSFSQHSSAKQLHIQEIRRLPFNRKFPAILHSVLLGKQFGSFSVTSDRKTS